MLQQTADMLARVAENEELDLTRYLEYTGRKLRQGDVTVALAGSVSDLFACVAAAGMETNTKETWTQVQLLNAMKQIHLDIRYDGQAVLY